MTTMSETDGLTEPMNMFQKVEKLAQHIVCEGGTFGVEYKLGQVGYDMPQACQLCVDRSSCRDCHDECADVSCSEHTEPEISRGGLYLEWKGPKKRSHEVRWHE